MSWRCNRSRLTLRLLSACQRLLGKTQPSTSSGPAEKLIFAPYRASSVAARYFFRLGGQALTLPKLRLINPVGPLPDLGPPSGVGRVKLRNLSLPLAHGEGSPWGASTTALVLASQPRRSLADTAACKHAQQRACTLAAANVLALAERKQRGGVSLCPASPLGCHWPRHQLLAVAGYWR